MQWPTVIVLDTQRVMKAFREHAEKTGKPLDFPDEMVQEIVSCLRHANRAARRLDSLLLSVLLNEFEHYYAMYVDSTVLTFIQELGELLIEQITYHNLYDEHGVLHYRYREPRVADFNCIVLKRTSHEHKPAPLWISSPKVRSF